ncbi:MAG: acetyltransferase [Blastopirellula sp.]|nr:MAG: acetyltransferase [Blastopirellula sp.]
MKESLKILVHALSLVLVCPLWLTSNLEARLSSTSETVFQLWAHSLSIIPGIPGVYLRRAYYCCTLESCSRTAYIGYGTIFSNRRAIIEKSVYIGTYTLLGDVILREGCLIGSRASLISGGQQHQRSADGKWLSADTDNYKRIEINAGAWLGEACLVAADVGKGAMIAAGSVVASKVPADVMVAGNPARFVKRFSDPED